MEIRGYFNWVPQWLGLGGAPKAVPSIVLDNKNEQRFRNVDLKVVHCTSIVVKPVFGKLITTTLTSFDTSSIDAAIYSWWRMRLFRYIYTLENTSNHHILKKNQGVLGSIPSRGGEKHHI